MQPIKIITEPMVKQLGIDIINAIKANTQAGTDRYGNRFIPYSQRPFAMPYGAVSNKTKARKARTEKKAEPQYLHQAKQATNGLLGSVATRITRDFLGLRDEDVIEVIRNYLPISN